MAENTANFHIGPIEIIQSDRNHEEQKSEVI